VGRSLQQRKVSSPRKKKGPPPCPVGPYTTRGGVFCVCSTTTPPFLVGGQETLSHLPKKGKNSLSSAAGCLKKKHAALPSREGKNGVAGTSLYNAAGASNSKSPEADPFPGEAALLFVGGPPPYEYYYCLRGAYDIHGPPAGAAVLSPTAARCHSSMNEHGRGSPAPFQRRKSNTYI